MKKIVALLVLSLFLTACSSKSNSVEVSQENTSHVQEYHTAFQEHSAGMNKALNKFNTGLDGLYTKDFSDEQFGNYVKGIVESSAKLVKSIEQQDVNPEIFEMHQKVILVTNKAHQLLLDAVDMANRSTEDNPVDKQRLKDTYISIKQEQASLVNEWKLLMESLNYQSTEE